MTKKDLKVVIRFPKLIYKCPTCNYEYTTRHGTPSCAPGYCIKQPHERKQTG